MKIVIRLFGVFLLILSICFFISCSKKSQNHFYAQLYYNDPTKNGVRGIKGTFLIPSTTYNTSTTDYLTFEQWIGANGATDSDSPSNGQWFELGFMTGATDNSRQGFYSHYKGMFKGKQINGQYWEVTIPNATWAPYTTNIFRIADTGTTTSHNWAIFIDNTSYGAFADNVGPAGHLIASQGYEKWYNNVNILPLSTGYIRERYFYSGGSNGTWSSITGASTYNELGIVSSIQSQNGGYDFIP